MESEIYKKLVSKTKKTQTNGYRGHTSGNQWGEGQYRWGKRVIMGLHETVPVKLWNTVKH